MFQGVFIAPELHCFVRVEGLKSHFLLIELIRDKYILYNINEMKTQQAIRRFFIHIWVQKDRYLQIFQLFVLGTMPNPRSMGMTANQTIVYLGLVCNRAQRHRVWQHTSLISNWAWHAVKLQFDGSKKSLDSCLIGLSTTKPEDKRVQQLARFISNQTQLATKPKNIASSTWAQHSVKLNDVSSGSSPDPHLVELNTHSSLKILDLAARQTYIHMGSACSPVKRHWSWKEVKSMLFDLILG